MHFKRHIIVSKLLYFGLDSLQKFHVKKISNDGTT